MTFVPGRASVCMRPAATRSDDELNTIGISEVLRRIAAATCSMPTSKTRARPTSKPRSRSPARKRRATRLEAFVNVRASGYLFRAAISPEKVSVFTEEALEITARAVHAVTASDDKAERSRSSESCANGFLLELLSEGGTMGCGRVRRHAR